MKKISKINNIVCIFILIAIFLCPGFSYSKEDVSFLRVPINPDTYSRLFQTSQDNQAEELFKSVMGSEFLGIRNFHISERTGRFVFQKELRSKKGIWITYYYENSVPVDLDGNPDDLIMLYKESSGKDENKTEIRYLVFKRLAKYRADAAHLKAQLKSLLRIEKSKKVKGEIKVAINMISGKTIDGGKRLKAAYVSYEIAEVIGRGGIKDVSRELPRTFRNKRGHDAFNIIPFWEGQGGIEDSIKPFKGSIMIEPVEGWYFELEGERVQIYSIVAFNRTTGKFEPIDGVPIYALRCAKYFSDIQHGDIYRQDLDRAMPKDSHLTHTDNIMTALFFSKAVLEAMKIMQLRPDIINTADWQTAHISTLLKKSKGPDKYEFFSRTKTLHIIHNIGPKGLTMASPYAAEGSVSRKIWDSMGIVDEAYQPRDQCGVEYHGKASLQKGGIVFADQVSTVGAGYSFELQTKAFGSGFEDINWIAGVLGIPNGISLREWNAFTCLKIKCRFKHLPNEKDRKLGVQDIKKGKAENKKALVDTVNHKRQDSVQFSCSEHTPIFCFVGRFDEQKGLHILLSVMENEDKMGTLLRDGKIKMIFAGAGNPDYQSRVQRLQDKYPHSIAYLGWIEEGMAKQLFAGADVNVMPSIFEPKGIVQMQGARFAVVNLVNKVGGLKDDIVDFADTEKGNGYVIDFSTVASDTSEKSLYENTDEMIACREMLYHAMLRAVEDFKDVEGWAEKTEMVLMDSEKFGWDTSCMKYEMLFNVLSHNYQDLFIPHKIDHFIGDHEILYDIAIRAYIHGLIKLVPVNQRGDLLKRLIGLKTLYEYIRKKHEIDGIGYEDLTSSMQRVRSSIESFKGKESVEIQRVLEIAITGVLKNIAIEEDDQARQMIINIMGIDDISLIKAMSILIKKDENPGKRHSDFYFSAVSRYDL